MGMDVDKIADYKNVCNVGDENKGPKRPDGAQPIFIHHFQFRNKNTGSLLTNDDLYPDRDDVLGDTVVLVLTEEKAHELRFKYEQEFRSYGTEVEIEVVLIDNSGHEVGVS